MTRPYDNQQQKRELENLWTLLSRLTTLKLKEREKDKYHDLVRELKKLWNMKVMFIPIVIGAHQRNNKENGGLEKKRTSGDHPNYCIIEIGQNTEKSPGDLRRHVATQTLVKDHQLMPR